MKAVQLLAIALCLWSTAAAKTYYFSASAGDDNRSSTQAQNPSTPWKSLSKLNALFPTLVPGDVILLKRGDTFYGTITPTQSGTASAPITIGAYGSGAKPLITGFTTLGTWTSIGSGKYESANSTLGSEVNMVSFDGAPQAMGRYPNSNTANGGYLNFESHGTSSITDKELPASPSWKGAELVVRTKRYVIDRTTITAHAGTKLSYSPALTYTPHDGFGYFIQNDIRTLDQLGEWYYNPKTKKLTMYFGSASPSNYSVKASTLDRLLYVYNEDNLVFDDLAFAGSNDKTIQLYSADNIVVKNSNITLSGKDAVFLSNGAGLKFEHNTVTHTNSMAVSISNCEHALIKNNTIENTGMLTGMGQNGAGKSTAIKETGDYNTIEANTIENTGYIGINFKGNYVTVKNNVIDGFNLVKDDGGGIYTQNASPDDDRYGQKLIGNIIVNGVGAAFGTTSTVAASTTGIYMDDHASGVLIQDNTVARCSKAGLYVHNAVKLTLRGNTLYDNRTQLILVHDQGSADEPIRGLIIKGNTFFSKTPAQTVVQFWTILNDIASFGTMDSNYYCRPLDDGYVIKATYLVDGKYINQDYDLQSWQQTYKKDGASKRTAAQVVPHKIKALLGNNRFTNGEFASSVSGINVLSSADDYNKTWHSNKLDKGTFQGTTSADQLYAYIMSIPIGAVTAGKNYLVKFTMQDSKDTRVNVFLRQAAGDYTILSNQGVKNVVRVGTTRKDYEFAFTPRYSEASTILFFEVYGEDHTVWADNIKVYEADVALTNPDDSLRLEYNGGQSSKTVALNGSYVDARGKVYTSSITLAPYTSAVLIKKGSGTSGSDGTQNQAPVVRITSPTAQQSYTGPASVTLSATASDSDGSIQKVEFYNGETILGSDTTSPYSFTWNNVPAGSFSLTAKAYDNNSRTAISEAVTIIVAPKAATKDTIIATNDSIIAPTVSFKTPVQNQVYSGPGTISMSAVAADADGAITKVEFYSGSTLLKIEKVAPYAYTWKNVAAGTYYLTAKATDNKGNTTTSSVVTVSVSAAVAPTVRLITPVTNQSYSGPATINMSAEASDADGTVSKVQFYNGSTLLRTENYAPYTYSWKDVPAGTYTITAKAIDNAGNITTSTAVTVKVGAVSAAATVSIGVAPNPVTNTLSVSASGFPNSTTSQVSIIAADGTVMKTISVSGANKVMQVDVSSLKPQTYMVQVVSGFTTSSKQFQKM